MCRDIPLDTTVDGHHWSKVFGSRIKTIAKKVLHAYNEPARYKRKKGLKHPCKSSCSHSELPTLPSSEGKRAVCTGY